MLKNYLIKNIKKLYQKLNQYKISTQSVKLRKKLSKLLCLLKIFKIQ